MGTSTSVVWEINPEDRQEWFKNHRKEASLVKKFEKFEKSVTANPYTTNPDVKKLKGPMKDYLEYVKGGSGSKAVRGVYQINQPASRIELAQFDWKGSINYR